MPPLPELGVRPALLQVVPESEVPAVRVGDADDGVAVSMEGVVVSAEVCVGRFGSGEASEERVQQALRR
jgi:hypothetical protein